MKKQIYICDPKIIGKDIAERVFDAEKYELHLPKLNLKKKMILLHSVKRPML